MKKVLGLLGGLGAVAAILIAVRAMTGAAASPHPGSSNVVDDLSRIEQASAESEGSVTTYFTMMIDSESGGTRCVETQCDPADLQCGPFARVSDRASPRQ